MSLYQTFLQKEREYGLPEGYLSRTAQIESSMNPNAKNPNSSAGGLFQFIDSTARQYGLSNKFDPLEATDAAARLARDNANALRRTLGRDPTAGELYLAHQQGSGGAAKLLANPDASAASVVGSEAARLNGGAGLTAGEMAQKWTSKIDGGQGDSALYGGAGDDDLTGGSMPQNPMPENVGGLGGLGGFVRSQGFGDWLSALGASLMQSPSNAPLSGMGDALTQQQALRQRQDAVDAQRAEADSQRMALKTLLRSQGYSEEEANAYSHNASAAGLAMDQRKEARGEADQNTTRAWLKEKYPDLSGLPVQDALQVARARMTGNGEGRYSTQPQYFRRADGTVGIGQLSSTGQMVETALPEGSEILSPYDMSFDRARGGAAGKTGGEALGNLPQAEGTAARVLQQVDDLKNDPYLPNMVGPIDSRLPNWSADAARVEGKMNQLQSGAFLEARTALKGGGAITDFESKKAEDAYLRANAAQNEKDYKDALDEFAYYTQQGLAKLRQQAGTAAPAPAKASAGGVEAMSDAELEAIANGR